MSGAEDRKSQKFDPVQERLQAKRVPFDNWSIREQLCLASAVLNSGDQNWMSVSRSLKMLCDSKRPPDWFSQKSCAAQYDKLLGSVETPKRKKRTEQDSSTPVEIPNQSIVRKLVQERVNELKKIMLEEQQQFQKLKDEILFVQNGGTSEAELREMWAAIEEEKRQKEIEKEKHDEWLKRREERKRELDRAWRPGLVAYNKAQQLAAQKAAAITPIKPKEEDVDCETTPQRSSSGQSPLLTSLLKSPSSTSVVLPTTPTSSTPTSRIISSGAQLNLSQSFEAYQSPEAKQQMSASQSAPTLSMLLDKNNQRHQHQQQQKQPMETDDSSIDITADIFPEQIPSVESTDGGDLGKDEEQLMEVFKGLIPDNIDELADILTDNNAIIPELLEEEEILEKVDEYMEDDETEQQMGINVEEIAKMDTFDQLKNESIIEERKKREAAAAQKAVEDETKVVQGSTSEDSQSVNVSPEDSNQEDDIPLKVIQKDILEANKAKEEVEKVVVHIDDHEDSNRQTPTSDHQSPHHEKTEIITDETSSTDPSGPIEIKQEPEDVAEVVKEVVKQEVENNLTTENLRKLSESDEEEIFQDAKEEPHEPVTFPTDTDDDSSSQAAKLDGSRSTRSSRKITEEIQVKSEDSDSRSSLATRARCSKEHERSESPIDDDSDNTPRRTRRFSSTPIIDSIPNSPIPEDKEQKAWRKAILIAYGRITSHKNAQVFHHLKKDESEKRLKAVFLRPIDMESIKKNVENGTIRTTAEFKRDIMLLCTNIMMTSPIKSATYVQAHEMMHESIAIIKTAMEGFKQQQELSTPVTPVTSSTPSHEKASSSATPGFKRGSRKSQRLP